MGEVHVERMIQKYKDRGEIDHELEDPALVMLKQWPASKRYQDNPDKLPSLEQQACRIGFCTYGNLLVFLLPNQSTRFRKCIIFIIIIITVMLLKDCLLQLCFADQSAFGDSVRKWTKFGESIWEVQRYWGESWENIDALCSRTWLFTCHQNTCEEMSSAAYHDNRRSAKTC